MVYYRKGLKMIETYTFSRALHLMRYGGKKMKCLEIENNEMVKYLFVNECQLYGMTDDDIQFIANLHSRLIMGSWIEVKE
jgi:hypothetical protein